MKVRANMGVAGMPNLRAALVSLCLLGAAGQATAACTVNSTATNSQTTDISGTVELDPSAPVGSVIKRINVPAKGGALFMTCNAPATITHASRHSAGSTGPIIPTNRPGIGWRVGYALPRTWTQQVTEPLLNVYNHLAPETIELVKTGPITPGILTGASLGTLELSSENVTWYRRNYSGNLVINAAKTCEFRNNGRANFDLGAVKHSALASNPTSVWVTGNLVSAGCEHVAIMTYSGTADSSNPALFAPTSAGAAKGIGIELQSYNGQAAKPNDPTGIRWGLRNDGESYQHRARMVRTTGPLQPGTVGATITVSVTYE